MKEIIAGIESYRMKKLGTDTEDPVQLKTMLCTEFGLEPHLTHIRQPENKKKIVIPPKDKDTGNLFEEYSEQIEGLEENDRGKNFEYYVLDYFWARELLIYGKNFKKIRNLKVLLIGAGALGNEMAKNLALSGVGMITIVDRDTIENPNLSKSIFFRATDIGASKAKILTDRIQELIPTVTVDYFVGDATSEYVQCEKCTTVFEIDQATCPSCNQPFDAYTNHGRVYSFLNFLDYDIVVSCVDNFSTREYLTKRCLELDIPFFDIGISGKRFDDPLEGNYVQVRNILSPDDPCIGCLLSEDQVDLFRDPQFGADPCGLVEKDPSSLSLMAIAASIQSEQILNYVTDAGKVLSSLLINTTTNSYLVDSITKNPDCPICSNIIRVQINQVDSLEDLNPEERFIKYKNRISFKKENKMIIFEVK